MDSLSRSITTRDLREHLADVVGRAAYGAERVGVTRHGKLAAVVIGAEDLELLERLEAERDAAEFAAAKAADDGERCRSQSCVTSSTRKSPLHGRVHHSGRPRDPQARSADPPPRTRGNQRA